MRLWLACALEQIPVLAATPVTLSVSPADFGGDPTGQHDSTTAVQAAVEHCYEQSQKAYNKTTEDKAIGAGNCEVYLGGEFKISSPILTPSFSNFIFGFGSLVAAANWSAPTEDNFLLCGSSRGYLKTFPAHLGEFGEFG